MVQKGIRYIALMDLDAFFASVEVLENPGLRGKPVLIGGSASSRGVVAAASYEARKFGIHSAMPMSLALRKCPNAIILPTRHQIYRQYSSRVMNLLSEATNIIEQVSIDEAYIELTECADSMAAAQKIMLRMQERIKDEIGLPASIGLGSNKMIAKIACEAGKPQGFVTVEAGMERNFLNPLAVSQMPGVGPKGSAQLQSNGLLTLGDIVHCPPEKLLALSGSAGLVLQKRAMGEDNSRVQTTRETKSISAEETFPVDINEEYLLHRELDKLSIKVADSLQKHSILARTVTVKLRNASFITITRSLSSPNATANVEVIQKIVYQLLYSNWKKGDPIRLVGVGVSNLRPRQIEGQLPFEKL